MSQDQREYLEDTVAAVLLIGAWFAWLLVMA